MRFCIIFLLGVYLSPSTHTVPEAEQRSEQRIFQAIMTDAGKAKVEILRFLKENPGGVGTRKKLVDFSSWHRSYGSRRENTLREREALYDISDYWIELGRPKGLSRSESDKEFMGLLQGPAEREGEGANVKIWVKRPKERYKDDTRCFGVGKETRTGLVFLSMKKPFVT